MGGLFQICAPASSLKPAARRDVNVASLQQNIRPTWFLSPLTFSSSPHSPGLFPILLFHSERGFPSTYFDPLLSKEVHSFLSK